MKTTWCAGGGVQGGVGGGRVEVTLLRPWWKGITVDARNREIERGQRCSMSSDGGWGARWLQGHKDLGSSARANVRGWKGERRTGLLARGL